MSKVQQQRRQAVSGVLAAVVLIGITITLAALVLTFGSDFIESLLVIEPINIVDLSIKNTGNTSYIHATVKNTSNNDLQNMQIVIFDSGDQLDEVTFSLTPVTPGVTTSVTQSITDGTNAHYLPYGTEVLVQITADTPTGISIETDPVTIRVSKN